MPDDEGEPRGPGQGIGDGPVQRALRAIDHVVVDQASLEGSVSPERVVGHLTGEARKMSHEGSRNCPLPF